MEIQYARKQLYLIVPLLGKAAVFAEKMGAKSIEMESVTIHIFGNCGLFHTITPEDVLFIEIILLLSNNSMTHIYICMLR